MPFYLAENFESLMLRSQQINVAIVWVFDWSFHKSFECLQIWYWFSKVMVSGLRTWFLTGEFGFLWTDLKSIFGVGHWIHYSYNVSSCYVVPCHARGRGDIGVVVVNEKGGCLLCWVNTTYMIHWGIGSSTFMRRKYCKGVRLRGIILTFVLHDHFAYELTRLVAPNERRVNRMEYVIQYMWAARRRLESTSRDLVPSVSQPSEIIQQHPAGTSPPAHPVSVPIRHPSDKSSVFTSFETGVVWSISSRL